MTATLQFATNYTILGAINNVEDANFILQTEPLYSCVFWSCITDLKGKARESSN